MKKIMKRDNIEYDFWIEYILSTLDAPLIVDGFVFFDDGEHNNYRQWWQL